MNDTELFQRVAEALSEFADRADVQASHHLVRDLQLDSIHIMDALQQLEDELDIVIPTDVLPRLQTVGDLVVEVQRCLSDRGRPSG